MAGVHFLARLPLLLPGHRRSVGHLTGLSPPTDSAGAQNSGSQPEAAPKSLGMGCE